MSTPIRNVLFDIGVVLLHLDYEEALRRMAPLCDPVRLRQGKAVFSLLERDPVIASYEVGETELEEVFGRFVAVTGFTGSLEDFIGIWDSIFSENDPMIRFGRELARTHPVYFVTNAGAVHIPRLYDRFPALRFFTNDAASCYLHAAKPEAAFYEKALSKFGLGADVCLFIDDRPENVAGAEACGIRSVLYTEPAETIGAVRARLGIVRAEAEADLEHRGSNVER